MVADYFRDKPVKKVWLFGSYARGEADEKSDVDLLVRYDDAEKRLSYFDLARFLGDLQERLCRNIDLVDEGALYARLRPHVMKDKTLLYSA